MTHTNETIHRLAGRPHINDALAGLDVLGMADSGLSLAELTASIADADVVDMYAFALDMVVRVFTKLGDDRDRQYWGDVAEYLAKRM